MTYRSPSAAATAGHVRPTINDDTGNHLFFKGKNFNKKGKKTKLAMIGPERGRGDFFLLFTKYFYY